MLESVRHEWHVFREDAPGQRFENHYARAQHGSRAARAVRVGVGVLLLVAGVAMLFFPGPGLLFMLFGAALLCSVSRRLARWLDRAEPTLRARAQRLAARWRGWREARRRRRARARAR